MLIDPERALGRASSAGRRRAPGRERGGRPQADPRGAGRARALAPRPGRPPAAAALGGDPADATVAAAAGGTRRSASNERRRGLVRAACSSDPRPARGAARRSCRDIATRYRGGMRGRRRRARRAACWRASPGAAREPVPPFGWEPILYATFSRLPRADPGRAEGLRAVVRLLLDAGADPNASFDHDGWLQVPLYGAAGILNDARLTAMLIAAGADPNDNGARTVGEALYHGCEFPDPACAALLIDAGTDRKVVRLLPGAGAQLPLRRDGRDVLRPRSARHGGPSAAGGVAAAAGANRAGAAGRRGAGRRPREATSPTDRARLRSPPDGARPRSWSCCASAGPTRRS